MYFFSGKLGFHSNSIRPLCFLLVILKKGFHHLIGYNKTRYGYKTKANHTEICSKLIEAGAEVYPRDLTDPESLESE